MSKLLTKEKVVLAAVFSCLGLVGVSCTKETKGKDPEVKVAPKLERKSGADAIAQAPGIPETGVSGDGIAREGREPDPFLKKMIEDEAKTRESADNQLRNEIKQEAIERKKADDDINIRVSELDKKVDGLGKKLEEEVKRLDDKDRELAETLHNQGKLHKSELDGLSKSLNDKFTESQTALSNARSEISQEISKSAVHTESTLLAKLNELKLQSTMTDADLKSTISALISSDISGIRKDLSERIDILKRWMDSEVALERTLSQVTPENYKNLLLQKIETAKIAKDATTNEDIRSDLDASVLRLQQKLAEASTDSKKSYLQEIQVSKTTITNQIILITNYISNSNNDLKNVLLTQINSNISETRSQIKLMIESLKIEIAQNADKNKGISRGELQQSIVELEDRSAKSDEELKVIMTNLITSKIDQVRAEQKALQEALFAQISKLNYEDKKSIDEINTKLVIVTAFFKLDNDGLRIAMQGYISRNISILRKDIRIISNHLSIQISDSSALLRADMGRQIKNSADSLREKLQVDINNRFDSVSKDIIGLKYYVDMNFATKAELSAVKAVVIGLQNITELMNKKIDTNDSNINNRLTNELKSNKEQLRNEIAAVQVDADSIRNALNSHINDYKSKVQQLAQDARDEARLLRDMISKNQLTSEQQVKELGVRIESLTNRVTAVEVYSQDLRKSLDDKLLGLYAKDAELSKELKLARDEASANLITAIKSEQESRKLMQKEIETIAAEVARIRDIATQALDLSKANEAATNSLSAKLVAAKIQFAAQIEGLRSDMSVKIGEVRAAAEDITAKLGKDVQKQFAEVSAALAELRARDVAIANDFGRIISQIMKDPVKVQAFISETRSSQDSLVAISGNLGGAVALVEQEFLLAIDFANGLKGVDIHKINESFKPIATLAQCGGISGEKPEDAGRNSSVGDKEWYWHLSRQYIRNIISGSRPTDAELLKVYFGTSPLVDGKSLASAISLKATPSYALGTSGDCVTKVQDWANELLHSKELLGMALRKAIGENPRFRDAVIKGLVPRIAALNSPIERYEAALYASLDSVTGSREVSRKAVEVGSENEPSLRSHIAQIIAERIDVQREIASKRMSADALTQVVKELAEAKDKANSNGESISELKIKLERLNAKIKEVENTGNTLISKVEDGLKSAFNLIAGMAARLGYSDFVAIARAEAGKIGGIIESKYILPVGCQATSHFFNYANEGQALQRCDSGVDKGDGYISDNSSCRVVKKRQTDINQTVVQNISQYQVAYYQPVVSVNSRCWVDKNAYFCGAQWNRQTGSTYWGGIAQYVSQSSTTQSKVTEWLQNSYVGVLKSPILPPTHFEAVELAKRPAGAPFPDDRKTMHVLRVYGNAWKWRLSNGQNSVDVDAEQFKVRDAISGSVYEIPASMYLAAADGALGFSESAIIQALDYTGKVQGKTCNHSMNGGTVNSTNITTSTQTNFSWGGTVVYNLSTIWTSYYSPIVFDLSGKGTVATVDPINSHARFDLVGRGEKQKVGWITPLSGFLVLDRNGNGRIDNGQELFGDHTPLKNGAPAANGYEALAEYDSNHMGYIDSKNQIYSKLKIWIDKNGDGESSPDELHSLASQGITRIGTRYEGVPAAFQAQHFNKPSKNLVLYQGQYWGPKKCGQVGCKTFDIYFGADNSLYLSNK